LIKDHEHEALIEKSKKLLQHKAQQNHSHMLWDYKVIDTNKNSYSQVLL
jgi:hypothetical protein